MLVYVGQGFVYRSRRYLQILFGVSVADISVVVRVQKDASTDKLRVERIPPRFTTICLIVFEGDVEHRRETAQLGPDVILVDGLLDLLQESAAFFPYIVEDMVALQNLYGFKGGNVAIAVREEGGRYEEL